MPESNADADKNAAEQAEKINAADALVFQTEKQLKEYGDKIPSDKKAAIESALAQLRTAHASREISQIDPALEALNTAWQAASQDIYQAQQEAGQPADGAADGAATGNGEAKDDDVTDVEFEEMDSNKN